MLQLSSSFAMGPLEMSLTQQESSGHSPCETPLVWMDVQAHGLNRAFSIASSTYSRCSSRVGGDSGGRSAGGLGSGSGTAAQGVEEDWSGEEPTTGSDVSTEPIAEHRLPSLSAYDGGCVTTTLVEILEKQQLDAGEGRRLLLGEARRHDDGEPDGGHRVVHGFGWWCPVDDDATDGTSRSCHQRMACEPTVVFESGTNLTLESLPSNGLSTYTLRSDLALLSAQSAHSCLNLVSQPCDVSPRRGITAESGETMDARDNKRTRGSNTMIRGGGEDGGIVGLLVGSGGHHVPSQSRHLGGASDALKTDVARVAAASVIQEWFKRRLPSSSSFNEY